MMRSRHQGFVTRNEGWLARLTSHGRRTPKLTNADETTTFKPSTTDQIDTADQSASDIQELEEGRSKASFVQAVVTVVEIAEEGLFRHIITYL